MTNLATRLSSTGSCILFLYAAYLVFCPTIGLAADSQVASVLERLQGEWIGEGPGGELSITIEGDSLYFYSREDHWYQTTLVLTPDTDPQQLHATIRDSAPPKKDIGVVVPAILEIQDGKLTLAVDDGADKPPRSFADARSSYHLEKIRHHQD